MNFKQFTGFASFTFIDNKYEFTLKNGYKVVVYDIGFKHDNGYIREFLGMEIFDMLNRRLDLATGILGDFGYCEPEVVDMYYQVKLIPVRELTEFENHCIKVRSDYTSYMSRYGIAPLIMSDFLDTFDKLYKNLKVYTDEKLRRT